MDITSHTRVQAQAGASGKHARVRRQIIYLCLFVLVVSPVVDEIIRLGNGRWHDFQTPGALGHALRWLIHFVRGGEYGDSWGPMLAALNWFAEHPGGRLYDQLFFVDHIKFQYPPSSLLLFDWLARMGVQLNNLMLNTVNWWVIAFNCVVNARVAVKLAARDDRYAPFQMHLGFMVALATLLYYPVGKAFELGQIQVWINALFSLAALAWLSERKSVAGLLIGLACLIKPQLALFLVWGAWRREWRFVFAWGVVALAGNLLAVATFGWQNHLDYLRVLHELSRTGESYIANQSFNGLLNRIFAQGDVNVFDAHGFPPYQPVVYLGTLATSVILIAAALVRPPRGAASSLLDFLCAGLTFTLASPIAWEHHFGLLPVVYVATLFTLLTRKAQKERTLGLAILSASFLLTGHWLGDSWTFLGVLALLAIVHGANHGARPQTSGDALKRGF
ncbi:glycosyltransferase family 87 protein [Paraburkholderia acidiphila]|uniref:DUF2029 domain-containing protein n=1 Tax=Paraburkholderia acidiphila TaxID=2571747 RepID=A0A7Z2GD97_9BURK|nr:glycosyltransferase family 87 protein [Paraburkholderia acidiphila]QGZ59628.1 DUF2029 domain-containing protein [Paraburkholderia acidiphila]